MAKYSLTRKAVDDLNSIWNYTFDNWSEYQADKYYNMLLGLCQEIANNPDMGRSYSWIGSDIFGLKAHRHIIFYRKINSGLTEITRILHGQMDIENRIIE